MAAGPEKKPDVGAVPGKGRGTRVERVTPISTDLLAERMAWLGEVFPEVVTEGKIDFDKLRASLGDFVEARPERYSFTWAGKRDAVQLLQVPSRATLVSAPDESVDFEEAKHLFIEGDNLEAMKLLHKAYFGRVKMIYIDPPYNTGGDFIYRDDFADPLESYLTLTKQTDAAGNLLTSNPETSGRYHSAWLSMMYPRLFLARQLLREDGFIIVSIDDHEVHNLKLLMNEVFGEENFLAQLVWKSRQFPDARAVSGVSTDHEYLLAYTRRGDVAFRGAPRDESKFSNPDNDPRGPWMSRSLLGLATAKQRPNLHYEIDDPATGHTFRPPAATGWRYSKERMDELIKEGKILFPPKPEGRPREKKFRSDLANEFMAFPTIIDDVFTAHGTAEIRDLFGFEAFDFPKPSELIRRLVEQVTSDEDIVLDLFAGSCTTGHAVLTQNRFDGGHRRFICVQLPEPVVKGSEAAEHGFSTIADIGKERLRRVIDKLANDDEGALPLHSSDVAKEDRGFRVFALAPSNYKPWSGVKEMDPEAYAAQMAMFADPLVDGWKPESVIWEVALKEGYSLTSHIEKVGGVKRNAVSRATDGDAGQTFLICLDAKLEPETMSSLSLGKDDLFICRDAALDDETAANLALQCHLKTI